MTIVASVLMLVFCVLTLGRYAAKVPTSVVAGFSAGIGYIMIVSQLNVIFGVGVLIVNAVAAVLAGCAIYALEFLYQRYVAPETSMPGIARVAE